MPKYHTPRAFLRYNTTLYRSALIHNTIQDSRMPIAPRSDKMAAQSRDRHETLPPTTGGRKAFQNSRRKCQIIISEWRTLYCLSICPSSCCWSPMYSVVFRRQTRLGALRRARGRRLWHPGADPQSERGGEQKADKVAGRQGRQAVPNVRNPGAHPPSPATYLPVACTLLCLALSCFRFAGRQAFPTHHLRYCRR